MNQQQQPIYYVQAPPQQRGNGCLWALAAFGLLALAGFLWALWGTMRYAADVNQVPAIFEEAAQTLQPTSPEMPQIDPQPGVVIPSTSTPFAAKPTAVVVTATQPSQMFDDHGLPNMGPYTLDQVEQCRAIIQNGHIDTLPSPQRELCEQYTRNDQ